MDEFAKLTISIAVCWNMFHVHQAHLHTGWSAERKRGRRSRANESVRENVNSERWNENCSNYEYIDDETVGKSNEWERASKQVIECAWAQEGLPREDVSFFCLWWKNSMAEIFIGVQKFFNFVWNVRFRFSERCGRDTSSSSLPCNFTRNIYFTLETACHCCCGHLQNTIYNQ